MELPFNPQPKPKHKRRKPKQINLPKKIANYVKERDLYKCVRCGNGSSIQLHHLVTRGRYDKKWYNFKQGLHDPRNLCVVCVKCHNEIHSYPEVMLEMLDWQRFKFGEVRRFANE